MVQDLKKSYRGAIKCRRAYENFAGWWGTLLFAPSFRAVTDVIINKKI